MSSKSVYIMQLPAWVGDFKPFPVNNTSLENFEGAFNINMPVQFSLQSGMFGGEVEGDLIFDGTEVNSPNLLIEKLPFLPKLINAISYCECALKGELDFYEFKQSIDSLSLPMSLRDNIINQFFEPAPFSSNTEKHPGTLSGNGLDKILNQVDLAQESTEAELAAERLVEAAAQNNTGFMIKKETAEGFLKELQALSEEVRRQLLASPELLSIFDLWLSLYSIAKAARSRNRQFLYLVPEGGLKSDIAHTLREDFEEFQCKVVLVYGAMPSPELVTSWESVCQKLECPLFLNWTVDSPETIDKLAEIQVRTKYQGTYVFAGYVAINIRYRGQNLVGWKPSHLSFCEGLIKNAEEGWALQGEYYRLEDQGILVKKGRTYVTRNVLSDEEWRLWVDQGVNMVNSKWNSDVALFKPLVPLQG